jgi:hypothetical protein
MKNKFIFLIFTIVFLNCYASVQPIEITNIKVLNSEFNEIKVINKPVQLIEINKILSKVELINKLPNVVWNYKLDIQAIKGSGRWLYNEEGYIVKLNYQMEPVYRIKDSIAFKKAILGN